MPPLYTIFGIHLCGCVYYQCYNTFHQVYCKDVENKKKYVTGKGIFPARHILLTNFDIS